MPKRFSFLEEEVDNFLDAVEEVLQISSTACKRVVEVLFLRYPNYIEVWIALRDSSRNCTTRGFLQETHLCPPAVCQANHLRMEIIDRLDASNLNLEEAEGNLEESGKM
jgi:hypothetical protein